MSKAFDTVNINKLIHTNISNIIVKFIANYIKGRKVYKLLEIQHLHDAIQNWCSTRRCSSSSPDTSTYDSPKHIQLITYADNILQHTVKVHIQTYLHSIHTWIKSNNLILNSDETTRTFFTPDPADIH